MAIPQNTIRTAQDIRTRSNAALNKKSEPQQLYLKLYCLEAEEARRNKEMESAQNRLRLVESRLQQLRAHKEALLDTVRERNARERATEGQATNDAMKNRDEGFRIRY